MGPESTWAAEASECAADQDAFWEYHDLLFDKQAGENRGAFDKENLKQWAADLDLDTEAFNECLDSGKYTELVATDHTGSAIHRRTKHTGLRGQRGGGRRGAAFRGVRAGDRGGAGQHSAVTRERDYPKLKTPGVSETPGVIFNLE